jgi:hypothetical protein
MTAGMIDQGYAPSPAFAFSSNVAFIPPGFEGLYKEPFSYTIVFNVITAGQTLTGTENVQNDSFFVVTAQMADIFDSATGLVNTQPQVAPMLVRIADSSSGKFQMSQPTPISALFGTGMNPAVSLYRARVFMPGGQIQAELTNNMGASQRVRLVFHGFKVYKMADNLAQM